MASQTQFKQQCPSCEAMVPIKDSSLVGKKVDCPKCKYRFVVEDPGNADGAASETKETSSKVKTKPDAPKLKSGDAKGKDKADADNGKAKKKKKVEKKGAPVMLIVGGGLGLVAVVGLIVGAILLFGGDSDKSTGSSGSGQQQNNSTSNTPNRPNTPPGGGPMMAGGGPMSPGGGQPQPSGDAGNNAAQPADHPAAEMTNLLPNETQAVYFVNIRKLLESSLGGGLFSSSSGYRPELFHEGFGLPIRQMKHFLRGESMKQNWTFNIVQMFPTFAIKTNELKSKLGSQKGAKSPISGHEYYVVAANDAMNSLSAIDFFSIWNPNASPYRTVPSTTMAWHQYDEQTLIVAELSQMEQFLQSDRKPKHLTQTQESQPRGPMGAGGFTPMGPGGMSPMGPMRGPAGAGGPTQPMGPMGPMGAGGPGAQSPMGKGGFSPMGPMAGPMGSGGPGITGPMGPALGGRGLYTNKPTYLTLNPDLKSMMDKMEEARQPVIFSCAGLDLESASQKIVDNIRATTTLGALIPLPTIVSAGLGLHTMSETRLNAVAAVELRREDDARTLHDTIQNSILERAATLLGKWMNITLETGARNNSQNQFGPGNMPPMGGIGGGVGRGPSGAGGGRPGGYGGAGFSPMGGGSGLPSSGGGGFSPMGGGSGLPSSGGGGFSPMGGGGGGRDSGGDAFTPGRGGAMGPMGGQGGPFGPGGFSPGGSPGSNRPPSGSSLTSSYVGKFVYVTIDAEINSDTDRKIRRGIENQIIRLKGMTDVAAYGLPRWHELAQTAVMAKSQNRTFRGTYALPEDALGKTFLSRGPNQRVSWMVDLLPMLGKSEIYSQIDPKSPWRTDKNVQAGMNWIPQFINPEYPRETWQARVSSLPGHDLGATHYVGLSGVGLDSAEWDENDPALRKKMGMFGYDRPTRFDDIPDGASNTIYMITAAPNVPRPWIAGGGATVQGVPEKNSIAPFVYSHGGKRGAYALMADGSVRFLTAETPDKVFQALVTKAGGDDSGDIESIAPKIAPAAPPTPKAAPKGESASTTGAWQQFTSKEGGFSVMFPPGKPAQQSMELPLPTGQKIRLNFVGMQLGAAALGVVYTDVPPEALAGKTPDQMFDASAQGIVTMAKGAKIKTQSKISLGAYPGREMILEAPGEEGVMTVRSYLIKNRVYSVMAGESKQFSSADAKKFLDSFEAIN